MNTTLIITLAVFLAPLLLTLIFGALTDYMRRRRELDPRRRTRGGRKAAAETKPSATGSIIRKMTAGLKDPRLISRKFERRDKWGINIKPSPLAPTWRRVYLILIIIQAALAYLGAASTSLPLMGVSAVIGFINLGMIVSNGGKCLESTKVIYDRMFTTLSQHMHLDKEADPKQYLKVQDWTLPDEPQIVADAKVQARQDGEYDQLKQDLPENMKHKPKVAGFRTTPTAMTVTFPVEFRRDATDDTLAHLNEIFGGKTEWVAERDVPDGKGGMKTKTGWEFENGIVYLRTVPPLPTKAALPENFNEGPYNIIKLGATVSGEGVWDINTTPMALVPLATDTMIWVARGNGDGWDAKRLDGIQVGDTLISSTGAPTMVTGITPVHIPDDMYGLTFRDYGRDGWQGSLFTVHAAGSHLWPVDTSATNIQIIPQEERLKGHESVESVSTRAIYDMSRKGNRAMLKPVQTAQRTVRWVSYSVVMEKPSEVMCLNVDAPDHTFLIACAHDGSGAHADSIDDAIRDGIPTHNCGSPLALDTPVPMHDGTTKTMETVTPGDVVIGSDGAPASVVSASPVMMPEHLYRITLEPDSEPSAPYSKIEGTKADMESA